MGSEKCDALIIDGRHSLFRATDKHQMLSVKIDGVDVPTGGTYGFLNIIIRTHAIYGGRVIVAWEGRRADNFRTKLYPAYKRRNEEMTLDKSEFIDEMILQERLLKTFLCSMGVAQYAASGGEADDVIGRLATHVFGREKNVYIYSGDSDLRQLVTEDNGAWIKTVSHNKGPNSRGGDKVYGIDEVIDKHGVPPSLIADLKALSGDSSDNIPGVKGIGPIMAAKLLNKYGNLDGVLDAASRHAVDWPVNVRFADLIHELSPQVRLYRQLTGLKLDISMTEIAPNKSQADLVELLKLYRFRSLIHAAELNALMKMG